ncbi:MAG TPA: hypothetical protein VMF58_14865 [Rhizomicrobium sp.]|nr:hypothetical protein [Rhizomicrobium sp.]
MAKPTSKKLKYALPPALEGHIDQSRYEKWLRRKASAHYRGDIKRFGQKHNAELYRNMIHAAVGASGGRDFYTGELLHWDKISTYDNAASKLGKSKYKAEFALLPSLDHVWKDDGTFAFVICGWRTNDAKADLPLEELLALCERILTNHGYVVQRPS